MDIKVFSLLGERLLAETAQPSSALLSVARRAESKFSFFTCDNILRSLRACAEWLSEEKLQAWVNKYPFWNKPYADSFAGCGDRPANCVDSPAACVDRLAARADRRVAIIMAGNLPFVGFHDVLCVLMAGFRAVIKPSSNDPYLWHYLQQLLSEISPETAARMEITDGVLRGFDAVIATGSNNSARYFEEYFAKYPNIIRKNRSSIAVLQGDESSAELDGLFDDMFSYFGLGCRNVSHIFLPKGYDVQGLAMRAFSEAPAEISTNISAATSTAASMAASTVASTFKTHNSYCNNYQYQRAIAVMNGVEFIDTGYALWIESAALQAHIGVINYSFYNDKSALLQQLEQQKDMLQCMVGKMDGTDLPIVPFGKAQQPSLTDYADGIDTMQFLAGL